MALQDELWTNCWHVKRRDVANGQCTNDLAILANSKLNTLKVECAMLNFPQPIEEIIVTLEEVGNLAPTVSVQVLCRHSSRR